MKAVNVNFLEPAQPQLLTLRRTWEGPFIERPLEPESVPLDAAGFETSTVD
jgi:hypothetical protein